MQTLTQDYSPNSYAHIGTLGDNKKGLTCSYETLSQAEISRRISIYPTFELARDSTLRAEVDGFWVPSAYPDIKDFIFDKRLRIANIYLEVIPDLVLAGRNFLQPQTVERIYHHPATINLLKATGVRYESAIATTSNSMACVHALEDPKNSIAATNATCAQHYKMSIYCRLTENLEMPFLLFTSGLTP